MTLSIKKYFKNLYKRCECGHCNCLIPIINKHGDFAKYKHTHYNYLIDRSNSPKGKNHCNWKGGEIDDGKYIRVKNYGHPFCKRAYIAKHRIVLEKYYSEKFGIPIFILPYFHVHHKDGNTRNNDISNLQMLPKSDHMKIHNPVRDTSNYICIYPTCKDPTKRHIKNGQLLRYRYENGWICPKCYYQAFDKYRIGERRKKVKVIQSLENYF